jgi:hypothetical protein
VKTQARKTPYHNEGSRPPFRVVGAGPLSIAGRTSTRLAAVRSEFPRGHSRQRVAVVDLGSDHDARRTAVFRLLLRPSARAFAGLAAGVAPARTCEPDTARRFEPFGAWGRAGARAIGIKEPGAGASGSRVPRAGAAPSISVPAIRVRRPGTPSS